MRGTASLPRRLERMEQRRAAAIVDAQLRILAEEYGLHPDEVLAELAEHQRRLATYGREPTEITIHRLATEFDLDETELRAEYERILARLESG